MKKAVILAVAVIWAMTIVWLTFTRDEGKGLKTVAVLQFTGNNLNTYQGFKDGLADLGYVEGRTIQYIFDGPVSSKNELPQAMARLLTHEPDIVFASPTPAALVAKRLTASSQIPVIFAPVNDPVSAGAVMNISHPEANLTGVRLSPSDGRRLQALIEVVPSVSRVFVPYTPGDKSSEASLVMLDAAASLLGVSLVKQEFYADTEVSADTGYLPTDVDAVLLPRDGRVMSRIDSFVRNCIARKLPLSTPRYKQVEAGALTGYGFNGYEIGRQSARMAHMVLSGKPVSSLPVETSTDYLFVNLKTAAAIGVHVDDAVLRRAHNVIR